MIEDTVEIEHDYCDCGEIATVGVHFPPHFEDDRDYCNSCFNATKNTFNRTK